ncbi:hypothetical protein N7523_006996 [Penicillium sp. IBT 18751x]|nr:hypothetical protein N7523_006996 [Penicillium sp. IBT 18751x]
MGAKLSKNPRTTTLDKHFQNRLHIERTRSAVFVFGLTLYGIDKVCMWPAGLIQSLGSLVLPLPLGRDLVCGPYRYSEVWINLAQLLNAIGIVVGPVPGSYAFFTVVDDIVALQHVQWVHPAIEICLFCVAVVFPEITDESTLTHFIYIGAQGTDGAQGAKLLAGAEGAFTVGRFLGSRILSKSSLCLRRISHMLHEFLVVTRRKQTEIGNLTFEKYSDAFHDSLLRLLMLSQHCCAGQSRSWSLYKRDSGSIIGGVCGGAVGPPALGHSAIHVAAWTHALAVNFVPSYARTVDKVGESTIGLPNESDKDEEAAI